jgi:predicted dehydrogenase
MIGWGILGTGRAARDFAAGLRHVPGAALAAVGSRSAAKAQQFALASGARRACGSYEELVADPGVDVVYVATPYALHKQHSLLALEAGKALLCEKPFASDAGEALEVIAAARRRRLFCMEAMWMHFLPGMQKAMDLIESGAIGEPRMLMADFGVPSECDPQSGPFSAALGGGAMMDRGVYPVALAWRLFGKPERVDAMATLAPTGVDEQSSAMIRYPGGQIATLSATLTGYAANEALIAGTKGRIVIREPLCRPERLTLSRAPAPAGEASASGAASLRQRLQSNRWARRLRRLLPDRAKTLHLPYTGNGFNYEASEVVRCLGAGALESRVWSLDQTAGVMQTLDLIRSRWMA